MLSVKHLIDTNSLTRDDIQQILDTAQSFEAVNNRDIKKVPALRGRTIVNLFLEPSTRTRSSFELAEKRLSADALNMVQPRLLLRESHWQIPSRLSML